MLVASLVPLTASTGLVRHRSDVIRDQLVAGLGGHQACAHHLTPFIPKLVAKPMSPFIRFPSEIDLILPRHPRAASQVRRALWSLHLENEDMTYIGALLLSETVGNAVEHASGSDVRVKITIEAGGELFCAVFDSDNRMLDMKPDYRQESPTMAEQGRGLSLMAAMSQAWGCIATDNGKWVWFRLSPNGCKAPASASALDSGRVSNVLAAATR